MPQTRRRVLASKIEALEGTGETLTATEAGIIALDAKWTPEIKMMDRSASLPTLSKMRKIPGLALGKISFKAELMGPNAAYSATVLPYVSPYLRACGFSETVVAGTSVTYRPASTGIPSLTMGLYTDGTLKKLWGARGTVKFTGKVGEPIYAEFDFMGAYVPVSDATILAPTIPGHNPPVMISSLITVGGYAPTLSSISIDMGNKLAPRLDANAASGYKGFMLTDRDPSGSFDPEMTVVATQDWYGLWKAGTSGALNVGAIGTSNFNKVQITAPTLVRTNVQEGDREGLELANTDFQLAIGSGDDEISIIFT